MKQMANGDDSAEIWNFGNVFSDIVVERQFALLNQQQHGHGRELLGHGSDVEYGRGSDGRAVFQIGAAVAFFVNDSSVFDNGQRAARGLRFVPPGEEVVNTSVECR